MLEKKVVNIFMREIIDVHIYGLVCECECGDGTSIYESNNFKHDVVIN